MFLWDLYCTFTIFETLLQKQLFHKLIKFPKSISNALLSKLNSIYSQIATEFLTFTHHIIEFNH